MLSIDFFIQVRVYTPKRVFQELEVAKEEYIRATLGVRNDLKLLLPKIVESFAKDSGFSPFGVVEMIQHFAPKTLRETLQRYLQGKSRKGIEWMPHNFAFRYLLSNELVKWFEYTHIAQPDTMHMKWKNCLYHEFTRVGFEMGKLWFQVYCSLHIILYKQKKRWSKRCGERIPSCNV